MHKPLNRYGEVTKQRVASLNCSLVPAPKAFSLIGKCHFPSDDEKEHAHNLVEDFVKRPLPPAFSYSLDRDD